ncbi:MAG: serine/threonine-protein kinase, partial [Nannocystaceae bacterium]
MALDDNISRFDAKGGDTHEPTASVAGGPSPEVESEELASPPSLLGTRPEIDGFDQVRTKMRARLLAIDPAGLDEAEVLVEPELPTKIGRYTVEDLLGRGGMGVVYLAVDDELERKLAIKLIRGAGGASGSEHARLRQEARAMARLSHPNVVTVHEVGEHDGQLYIAMEYVQGCSLTQWLEMKRRPWREVLAVMLAAGQGLAAAHAAGIVHRDFKPDNILVGDDGRARVADFGLAWTGQGRSPAEAERTESTSIHSGETHELRHTKTGTILGTLAYMAPEQYRGAPPSFAADQFSFCAALYRTLYDHLPFDATSSTHYQARVRSGDVRPAPAGVKVPKAVRAAILRGLAPRPQERWPSLDALLLGLRQRSRPMRWVPLVAVVLATVAALAVALTVLVREQPASGCRPVSEVLAGIWDDQVQERLQRHFASASTPKKSALAWQTIRTALGQHNDRWVLEYTKTCHERSLLRERGDATSELVALEQVLTCLKVERETFAELLNRIGGEGVDDVDAMLAATSLPTPELCRIAPATELGTTDLPINRLRMLRARKLLARSSV